MRFLLYLFRWQVSAVVMMPLMLILERKLCWPLWATLPAGQMFGGFVFWNIDKWIFREKVKND